MLPFSYYAGGPACAQSSAYCYGLRWTKDCKGRTMVGHNGGLPGFGSNWMMLPDYGIGVVSFSNLTMRMLLRSTCRCWIRLIRLARLKPRTVAVTPILEQRKAELIAMLPGSDKAAASGIFAENFFLDYFVDSLKKEAAGVAERAGKIVRVGGMRAENNWRGCFVLEGEKGNIEVRFTLTPETRR